MKFLGIDLGWTSGASGLCCLIWQDGLQLLDLERRKPIADILTWVDTWIPPNENGMIAVDAPTLIPNATGMRLVDRLTHRYFGRYHAGCYPANLNRPFAARTTNFGLSLEARGFTHAPTLKPRQYGRYQIEVFPHAATIHLFNLKQILKYKRGRLAERRAGLMRLRQLILSDLPALEPRLCQLDLPEVPLAGHALKDLEDRLDSLICAYVAAHWWYWGLERNWVLGIPEDPPTSGYIVVPGPLNRDAQFPSTESKASDSSHD